MLIAGFSPRTLTHTLSQGFCSLHKLPQTHMLRSDTTSSLYHKMTHAFCRWHDPDTKEYNFLLRYTAKAFKWILYNTWFWLVQQHDGVHLLSTATNQSLSKCSAHFINAHCFWNSLQEKKKKPANFTVCIQLSSQWETWSFTHKEVENEKFSVVFYWHEPQDVKHRLSPVFIV